MFLFLKVTNTLNICQQIATATGPNVKAHVKTLGPAIVGCFGDSKPGLRATAATTLNAWVEQTGIPIFVESEVFNEALQLENPNLRQEVRI